MSLFSTDFLQSIKDLLTRILGKKKITSQITLQVKGVNMNALELQIGQSVVVTIIPEKADNTPSNGKLSNVQVDFEDNSALASAVVNQDNTFTVKGLAASMGTIRAIVNATVTDTDGYIGNLALPFTVTVDPDPNFADRSTQLDLNAGTPA